jgi:preprotein translocase subunit SecG
MTFVSHLLMVVLLLTTLFLIVLVLIQRGKGGGLAGAFGGMGGQSAFGTKAGDLFTKITIGVSLFWILLCIAMIKVMGGGESALSSALGEAADTKPAISAPPTTEKQTPGKTEAPVSPEQTPVKEQ